jgi:RNA polymerase sigma factor (TIGR02999 family)
MTDEKQTLPSIAPDCGESGSSNELFRLVYDELHKLAAARLKHERPGQTLQPTALVHEVFLRLVAPNEHQMWDNIPHFFSAAASAMRRILIDNARKKHSLKRGGDHQKVEFALEEVAVEFDDEHLIRLDEALAKLAEQDPVKAKLIELRFFGGLTVEQSCEALGISRATANRYWNYARAWLFLQVSENSDSKEAH